VRLSARGDYVNFDGTTVQALSPGATSTPCMSGSPAEQHSA
jgi:hypothetical protein